MDATRLGALIRAIRKQRGLRQRDLAALAGVSASTVSRLEAGNVAGICGGIVDRVATAVDVRTELTGSWRGGDAERLLNWRHSLFADRVLRVIEEVPGWLDRPEVSFSIYGERGFIDQLCWHEARKHLLIIELKTEFVDINELLGTLDRKVRLAPKVAVERGWSPELVSVWLIVADTKTNRRHAAQHDSLLKARFDLDGRSFLPFLRNPTNATRGMAFLPEA